MVGAEPEDFEAVRPLLEAAGSDVFHVGPPGHGITLKIVHNLLSLTMLAASCEAMVLAAQGRPEPAQGRWRCSRRARPATATCATHPESGDDRRLHARFRTVLGQKDLRLGRNLAASLGVPLQTLGISSELFTAAVAKGRGEWSSRRDRDRAGGHRRAAPGRPRG